MKLVREINYIFMHKQCREDIISNMLRLISQQECLDTIISKNQYGLERKH